MEPIYDMYCIRRRQYQRFLNILFWGCLSGAVGSVKMSGVVVGGVVEVVGSNLARGKIFTASIGSVDSLYPSVYIYIYIYIYISIYIYIVRNRLMHQTRYLSWSDSTRKLRESYWIRRLNTLCPFGINKGD